jgi:hypothetical protein
MKKSQLNISYNLTTECPYCGVDINLKYNDPSADGFYSTPIFNNRWDDLIGEFITCQHCDKIFKISNVELLNE